MVPAPPVRRRLVGRALRRYRENLGYTLSDAARVLECHASKVSRIETGERDIRAKELRELVAEYGIGGEQLAMLTLLSDPRGAFKRRQHSNRERLIKWQIQVRPRGGHGSAAVAAVRAESPTTRRTRPTSPRFRSATIRTAAGIGGPSAGRPRPRPRTGCRKSATRSRRASAHPRPTRSSSACKTGSPRSSETRTRC